MHLGNGEVDIGCAAIGWAVSLPAILLSLRRECAGAAPQPVRFAAACAAVFAAQAFNVTVLPGISGHLVGGVLLCWWFGPAWSAAGMASILLLQSILLGDGGWVPLGLNLLNMAVIPCLLVGPVVNRFRAESAWARHLALGVGAWVSIVLASLACGIALLHPGLVVTIVSVHAAIGLLEAVLTVVAVLAAERLSVAGLAAAGAGAFAGAVLLGTSPFGDGLEYAIAVHGLGTEALSAVARLADSAQSRLPDLLGPVGLWVGMAASFAMAAAMVRLARGGGIAAEAGRSLT